MALAIWRSQVKPIFHFNETNAFLTEYNLSHNGTKNGRSFFQFNSMRQPNYVMKSCRTMIMFDTQFNASKIVWIYNFCAVKWTIKTNKFHTNEQRNRSTYWFVFIQQLSCVTKSIAAFIYFMGENKNQIHTEISVTLRRYHSRSLKG